MALPMLASRYKAETCLKYNVKIDKFKFAKIKKKLENKNIAKGDF